MVLSFRLAAAVLIVAMISTGQILFKVAAERISASGGQLTTPALSVVALSLGLYGIATLGWIWVLQWYPLSRIYPLMALSFVLVPLAGAFIFGERLTFSFFAGTALLLAGLFVIVGSQAR
jgi:drug/metabolite transporter (DMT)-like permease